jgi:hypothetical protein
MSRESSCWDESAGDTNEASKSEADSNTAAKPASSGQSQNCWTWAKRLCRRNRTLKKVPVYPGCDETLEWDTRRGRVESGHSDHSNAKSYSSYSKVSTLKDIDSTSIDDFDDPRRSGSFEEDSQNMSLPLSRSVPSKPLSRTKRMGLSERGVAIALRPTPRKKLLTSLSTSSTPFGPQPTSSQLLPLTGNSQLGTQRGAEGGSTSGCWSLADI